MSSKGGINSFIGPGSFFEGCFYIAGSLEVDGKFEGEIKTNGTVIVGKSGKIKTNIHAKDVVMEGTMVGNIMAENTVRLETTGKVLGDISSPIVHIAQGVIAKGQINIIGNSKKGAPTTIQEAYDSSSSNFIGKKDRKNIKIDGNIN